MRMPTPRVRSDHGRQPLSIKFWKKSGDLRQPHGDLGETFLGLGLVLDLSLPKRVQHLRMPVEHLAELGDIPISRFHVLTVAS